MIHDINTGVQSSNIWPYNQYTFKSQMEDLGNVMLLSLLIYVQLFMLFVVGVRWFVYVIKIIFLF